MTEKQCPHKHTDEYSHLCTECNPPQKTEHITLDAQKHELDSLKGQRNYKGVTVMRIIGGFQVFNTNVATALEVDELLEKAAKAIGGSLVVKVGSGSNVAINSQEAK